VHPHFSLAAVCQDDLATVRVLNHFGALDKKTEKIVATTEQTTKQRHIKTLQISKPKSNHPKPSPVSPQSAPSQSQSTQVSPKSAPSQQEIDDLGLTWSCIGAIWGWLGLTGGGRVLTGADLVLTWTGWASFWVHLRKEEEEKEKETGNAKEQYTQKYNETESEDATAKEKEK
jgi:hypothetical protein